MSDETAARRKEMEAEKLRLLERLATLERDLSELAEFERIRAKFGLGDKAPADRPNTLNQAETEPMSHDAPQTLAALAGAIAESW
jgi:hypothetical protein